MQNLTDEDVGGHGLFPCPPGLKVKEYEIC